MIKGIGGAGFLPLGKYQVQVGGMINFHGSIFYAR